MGTRQLHKKQYGAVDKSEADWPVFESQLYYLPAMFI